MKTFTLAVASTLTIAAVPLTAAQSNFRHLQQNGNWRPQNAFPINNNNANAWQPVPNVGSPWGNQGAAAGASPEAFPQAGVAANGGQQATATGAVQPEGLEQPEATTEAPATTKAPVATGAGSATGTGAGEPAQATIMVLLPDFLAPMGSGSGSTMVIAGSPDGKGGESGLAGSGEKSGAGETKSSATNASLHTVVTAVVLVSAAILGLAF